ncbi:hypothetical protein EAH79_12990 [Sphingomonas koreensis]|nr:hypothetical protein EAH79_12990 [Sphingomonas koreensis]
MFSGKIFRSRWAALLWAAGIIWTAYDVAEANAPPAKSAGNAAHKAESTSTDATGSDVSKQDLAILAQFADGK